MWCDLTIILRLIVHCPRSRRLEPPFLPQLRLAPTPRKLTRATRGYSRSATVVTVPLSASTLNSPRPPVVGIPGWRDPMTVYSAIDHTLF